MTRSDPDVGEELAELRETVERLTQMIDVLTSAVDELSDLLQWHINNASRDQVAEPVMLKSMPLDPTTKDWKINRVRAEAQPAAPVPTRRAADGTLFD